MADFRRAHTRLLTWEGAKELSTDRYDIGNYYPDMSRPENFVGTYEGVSALAVGNIMKARGELVGGKVRPTVADLIRIATNDGAAQFYKPNYWDSFAADRITLQPVAEALVDWKWVGGNPIGFLHRLGLTTNGRPDPAKINAYPNAQQLLDLIAVERWKEYRTFPTFWKHGPGWERRIAAHTRAGLTNQNTPPELVEHWRSIWRKIAPPATVVIVPTPTPSPASRDESSAWPWVLGTVALATAGYFAFPYLTGERKA